MSSTPPHLPRPPVDDDQREAFDRLSRLHAPGDLRASFLALLLTPDSQRELRAWKDETRGLSSARTVLELVNRLSPAARLPWFEQLLLRLSGNAIGDRQALVEAARRVMAADGQIRPIDRLRWVALRHRLGDMQAEPDHSGAVADEIGALSLHTRREIGRVTAFLSRLVPAPDDAAAGQGWYLAVMSKWLPSQGLPPCVAPDADGLVNALAEVQAMPWMLRPVLVRAWVGSAIDESPLHRLHAESADALRLASLLLDSPIPPELARYYVEPGA